MRSLIFALCVAATACSVAADEPRATNPIGYKWIVSGCANWDCANTAMQAAHGDANTVVLPTNSVEFPWVVLRRVEQGSVYVPPDEHFDIEAFDGIAEAAARWASIEDGRAPILVTSTGNSKLVVSLKSAGKQRAVRR